jgi:hypothetical protein
MGVLRTPSPPSAFQASEIAQLLEPNGLVTANWQAKEKISLRIRDPAANFSSGAGIVHADLRAPFVGIGLRYRRSRGLAGTGCLFDCLPHISRYA